MKATGQAVSSTGGSFNFMAHRPDDSCGRSNIAYGGPISMPILPVIDLMGGQVVRGVAGRREAYRPMVSTLTDSSDPLAVACAFRKRFGFEELYLADLDAIAGGEPASALYKQLQK